ncbi:MAG TPA: amidohydrolase family protein [Ignavibacteriaceae bacterium]|nr:amidohydrolase family protein [Ignavibacteriaceae bacterium]
MISKKLLLVKFILSSDNENKIYKDCGIEIENDKIVSIRRFTYDEINSFKGEVVNGYNLVAVPGFIQTHLHLCQTLFRGLADDLQLLDWLQYRIFPFENAHDKNSLRISAQLGLNELIKGGTTTILDMGTLKHQEVIFDELSKSGIRAFAGKCMMDENELYPGFCQSTNDELKITNELAKEFHNNSDGRIKYGFAPRFVLSCSTELLTATKEMMKDFEGSIFHTHASENTGECAEVRSRHGVENIEYFDRMDLLNDHTVLAHCVHLNDDEIDILKNTNSRVSHCPSSNLKLGSGIADIPRLMKNGINVSLGADGAPCNNELSIFQEMRLASLIQKPIYGANSMDALSVFRLGNIEGAKALHIDNITGSIEVGKKADIVLMDLSTSDMPVIVDDNNLYSSIVYNASKNNVKDVFINGEHLIKNRTSIYDEEKIMCQGKEELTELLKRI